MNIETILKYLSDIFGVFKRDPALSGERAEKRDIKNQVRAKKAEAKILKIEKRINRRKRKKQKRENN